MERKKHSKILFREDFLKQGILMAKKLKRNNSPQVPAGIDKNKK
jgi:hypothetical protein